MAGTDYQVDQEQVVEVMHTIVSKVSGHKWTMNVDSGTYTFTSDDHSEITMTITDATLSKELQTLLTHLVGRSNTK